MLNVGTVQSWQALSSHQGWVDVGHSEGEEYWVRIRTDLWSRHQGVTFFTLGIGLRKADGLGQHATKRGGRCSLHEKPCCKFVVERFLRGRFRPFVLPFHAVCDIVHISPNLYTTLVPNLMYKLTSPRRFTFSRSNSLPVSATQQKPRTAHSSRLHPNRYYPTNAPRIVSYPQSQSP